MILTTITVTTTATNLRNLLAASYGFLQDGFSEIRIESNTSPTNPVFVGDARVTNAIYAAALPSGSKTVVPFGTSGVDLSADGIFFVSTGGNETVHIWLR